MESLHSYFGQFQNTEAQLDRSVDDYYMFLLSNRYEIVADNVPVECGGFSYEFLCTSRISNQFEVNSFTKAIHCLSKHHIVEVLLCACKNDDFPARLFAVLKSMYGLSRHSV